MVKSFNVSTPSRSSTRPRKTTILFNSTGQDDKQKSKKRSAKKDVEKPKTSKGSRETKTTKPKSKKSSNNEEYEIDKIVDHRIYDQYYVEYCVTWKGYPKEKTWLTEYDLREAKELLADYKYSVTHRHDKEGEEFVVQEILAHRDVGKKRYYLVHWKGWDNPVSHTELEFSELERCQELLNNYKKAIREKGKAKKRRANGTENSKLKKKKKMAKKSRSETTSADEEEEELNTSETQEDD